MTQKTVISEISSLITAIRNCEQSGNVDWESRHHQALTAIERDYLPHGAGLDATVAIDRDRSTTEKIVIVAEFHHMNGAGFYDGWTEHSITARPSFLHGMTLTISGSDRNGIKDYLADIFEAALASPIKD